MQRTPRKIIGEIIATHVQFGVLHLLVETILLFEKIDTTAVLS